MNDEEPFVLSGGAMTSTGIVAAASLGIGQDSAEQSSTLLSPLLRMRQRSQKTIVIVF
jgi:hypothetical protein